MPESLPHKICKKKVAREIGGKTEVWSEDHNRRFDVKRNNIIAEIKCRRGKEGKMACVIEYSLKEKGKTILLGERNCSDLS